MPRAIFARPWTGLDLSPDTRSITFLSLPATFPSPSTRTEIINFLSEKCVNFRSTKEKCFSRKIETSKKTPGVPESGTAWIRANVQQSVTNWVMHHSRDREPIPVHGRKKRGNRNALSRARAIVIILVVVVVIVWRAGVRFSHGTIHH